MKKNYLIPSIIILVSIAISASIYFYKNPISFPVFIKPLDDKNSNEYVSPYGYSFRYPKDFRLATKAMNFIYSLGKENPIDAKEVSVFLTLASEEEENNYIERIKEFAKANSEIGDVTNPNAVYLTQDVGFPEFYPEKTIIISPGPSLETIKEFAAKESDNSVAEGLNDITEIESLEEIKSIDGSVGLSYLIKPGLRFVIEGNVMDSPRPAKIVSTFPLKTEAFRNNELPDGQNTSSFIQFMVGENSPESLKGVFRQIIAGTKIL